MKKCRKCEIDQPLDEFPKDRSKRDGHRNECRTCRGAKPRDHQPPGIKRCGKCKIPKPFKQFSRGNRTKNGLQSWCKTCSSECSSAWAKAQGPDYHRKHHLQYMFGLSIENHDRLLTAQGGVCAICRRPPSKGTHLVVDHSHKTGKIRGLLCSPCNKALGFLQDSIVHLTSGINYLTNPPANLILRSP